MTTNETLIQLLARTDALFVPIRTWTNPRWVAGVVEVREKFLFDGLSLDGGGGDSSAEGMGAGLV